MPPAMHRMPPGSDMRPLKFSSCRGEANPRTMEAENGKNRHAPHLFRQQTRIPGLCQYFSATNLADRSQVRSQQEHLV
jgi:hypothetical protein